MNGLDIYIYGYIWHSCSFYSNCRKWFQSIYCYYINSCPLQMENNTFGIEPHLIPIDGWLVIFTCKGCNLRQNVGLGYCRKWFQSIYCYYINSCPLQMENNTFGIEPHLIPIDGWLVIFTCKGCNLRQNVGLGWCNYFVLTTLRFGIFFSDFLGSTKWWLWGMGWYGTGISTAQGFKDCNFQPGCRSSQYIQPVDLFYEERLRKFNLFILTISWSHRQPQRWRLRTWTEVQSDVEWQQQYSRYQENGSSLPKQLGHPGVKGLLWSFGWHHLGVY